MAVPTYRDQIAVLVALASPPAVLGRNAVNCVMRKAGRFISSAPALPSLSKF
jgi:hypothetical protein